MSGRDTVGVSGLICTILALLPASSAAQSTELRDPEAAPISQEQSVPAATYSPITNGQRVKWIVDGTVGVSSLTIGIVTSAWETAWNPPEEWERTFQGYGKRYLQREADVAISSTIEAGLGALWGEEPRYIPSHRRGLWPRTRYAMKTVFLAQRRDGQLAPAWGRIAGNVFNNVIENTWLPPSVTTGGQTTLRTAQGFAGRLIGNLWAEFSPELKKRFPGAKVFGFATKH